MYHHQLRCRRKHPAQRVFGRLCREDVKKGSSEEEIIKGAHPNVETYAKCLNSLDAMTGAEVFTVDTSTGGSDPVATVYVRTPASADTASVRGPSCTVG